MLVKKYAAGIVFLIAPIVFGAPMVSEVYGQTAPVPSTYQDLYSAIDTNLSSFAGTMSSSWNGATYPVAFSAELKSAHSNLGAGLLGSNHYSGVLMEVDSLKALGVKAITVNVNFPVLYSGFYSSQTVYQQYVSFYSKLASDIHARGLKLIVETVPTFSNGGFTSLNVGSYYSSLTPDQYNTGRAQTALSIAQNMKPDYLSVLTEPDTEAAQSGISNLGTVSGSTALLSVILSTLQQAGVQGVSVGAGVGSWIEQYQSYVQSFAATSINYVDVHVYPINSDYLPRLLTIADTASSYGKPLAMSEAWLAKVRDSELITLPADQTFARDPFSFWAPLDARFLTLMWQFSNYRQLQFFSPSWTEWFHIYLDYNATSGLTPGQIFSQAETQVAQRIAAGQYTSTGLGYGGMLIVPADTTAPTAPTGLWGGAVSSGINLIWNGSTDNVGVAGYNVYRDGALIGTTAALYYIDTGLTPLSSHVYQVAAYDASGNISGLSNSLSATVAADKTPPSVPTQLAAQTLSPSQIALTWAASTDNVAIANYTVYRNGSAIATVTSTSYTDSGLASWTSYTYAVSATDTSGNSSAQSSTISARTADGTPPSIPAQLAAQVISASQINLTWAASTDNVAVASYTVYRNGNSVATTTATSFSDTGLASGTSYKYAVLATDTSGNASALSPPVTATTLTLDTTPPTVPNGLTGRAMSASSIALSWFRSTDNVGVAGYKIYRGTSRSSLAQINTTGATQYTDTGLASNTTYYYAVGAYDQAGNTSALSFTIAVKTSRH
jgi:chitodextrinase